MAWRVVQQIMRQALKQKTLNSVPGIACARVKLWFFNKFKKKLRDLGESEAKKALFLSPAV